MLQSVQNNFTFGEIGDRLNANRGSEIYKNSAKEIKNMLITDIGTLRVAKQFESKDLAISGDVVKVIDIKLDRYVILTSTHLYQMNKHDNTVKYAHTHSMGDGVDCSLIGRDYIAVFNKKSPKPFKIYQIDVSDEYRTFEYMNPLKDKKVIELSFWRVSKDPLDKEGKKFRVTPMSVTKNPKIRTQDGNIYLSNSDIRIKRIYVDYNHYIDETYFDGLADGDIYAIMRAYYKPKQGETYVVDNKPAVIGSLTTDSKYKGKYFTTMSVNNADGEFTFGKLIDISQPSYISFYQDRTIFYHKNYMYFSKVRDSFNFRNDINADSPFFIQLNPINNNIGELIGMISSNSLIVLTTAGIYSIGGQLLTPQSIGACVHVVSDMSVKDSTYDMLDNVIYFKNSNDVLKVAMIDNKSLQLAYNGYTVDKYSINNTFGDITKLSIEDKDYMMVRSRDSKTMYLIEKIDEGLFRRTSLDFNFEGKPFGILDRFIIGNKVYTISSKNYVKAKVVMNTPAMSNNNNILMDNSSSITSIAVKFIDEDMNSIKKVVLSERNTQQLRGEARGDIYKVKTRIKVKEGIVVDLTTTGEDKVVELLSVQSLIDVVEDK